MKRGFTLIELLIVLAIFGILSAMIIPVITGNSKHGIDTSYAKLSRIEDRLETQEKPKASEPKIVFVDGCKWVVVDGEMIHLNSCPYGKKESK